MPPTRNHSNQRFCHRGPKPLESPPPSHLDQKESTSTIPSSPKQASPQFLMFANMVRVRSRGNHHLHDNTPSEGTSTHPRLHRFIQRTRMELHHRFHVTRLSHTHHSTHSRLSHLCSTTDSTEFHHLDTTVRYNLLAILTTSFVDQFAGIAPASIAQQTGYFDRWKRLKRQ